MIGFFARDGNRLLLKVTRSPLVNICRGRPSVGALLWVSMFRKKWGAHRGTPLQIGTLSVRL